MWFGEVARVTGLMGSAVPHMAGPSMSQHVFQFKSGSGTTLGSFFLIYEVSGWFLLQSWPDTSAMVDVA
jgi:hypothetical protein